MSLLLFSTLLDSEFSFELLVGFFDVTVSSSDLSSSFDSQFTFTVFVSSVVLTSLLVLSTFLGSELTFEVLVGSNGVSRSPFVSSSLLVVELSFEIFASSGLSMPLLLFIESTLLGSKLSFEIFGVSVGVVTSLFVLSSSMDSELSFGVSLATGVLTSFSVFLTLFSSELSFEMFGVSICVVTSLFVLSSSMDSEYSFGVFLSSGVLASVSVFWILLGSELSFEMFGVSIGIVTSLFVLSSSINSKPSFVVFLSSGVLTSFSVFSTLLGSELSFEVLCVPFGVLASLFALSFSLKSERTFEVFVSSGLLTLLLLVSTLLGSKLLFKLLGNSFGASVSSFAFSSSFDSVLSF